MKSKFLNSILLLTAVTAVLVSCKKEVKEITDRQYSFDNNALVQVYMGTVSATRNYVLVDNVPVTGAALALGGIFPSTGHAASVAAGSRTLTIKDTLATSTQAPYTLTSTFTGKKYYTLFMYDTITSPKCLLVENDYQLMFEETAKLRFANLIFSKTVIPAVDIFSKRQNANLFSNVPIAKVTDFVQVNTGISDTLIVRQTGTSTQLAVLNSLVLQRQHFYTVVFRGSYGATSGTNARTLSSFTNY